MPELELESQFLLDKMIENLPNNGAMVAKINAILLINLEKEGKIVKQYTFHFKKPDPSIREGDEGKADVTVNIEDGDFVKICFGQLDTAKAFMTKRIRISGKLALLQRVQTVLKTVQATAEKHKSKL